MQRVQTFAAGDVLQSSVLNDWQDKSTGLAQLGGVWIGEPPVMRISDAVYVGPAPQLFINGKLLPARAGGNLTLTDEDGAALVQDTWYYVYAKDNAGAIGYEISTTTPDTQCVYKSNSTLRAYVGCFRTIGNSNALVRGVYRNRQFFYNMKNDHAAGWPTNPHHVLIGGAATAVTAIDLIKAMPPYTRIVELEGRVSITTGAATEDYAVVMNHGSAPNSTSTADMVLQGDAHTGTRHITGIVTLDVTNQYAYYFCSASTGVALSVFVHSFVDKSF